MQESRSKEGILPFDSAHSKLVSRSIAKMCFRNFLRKSCVHSVEHSFGQLVERLMSAGFLTQRLPAVAETLSRK